ncbi:MAG: hypothetical protein KDB21_02580 [Acidimicrobiales bacterium]|nr:hypothetical protein [Acidimicrobiales bacterium]
MDRWGALRRPVVAALAALAMTVAIGAPMLVVALDARDNGRADTTGILVGGEELDGRVLVRGQNVEFAAEDLIAVSYAVYPKGTPDDSSTSAVVEGRDESGPGFVLPADEFSRSVVAGDYDLFATFRFADGHTDRRVAMFTLREP